MVEFSYPNINLVDVDDTVVIEYVKNNHKPEDIFDYNDLAGWATSNGFIEE